ncbi:hypothetical protein IWW45_002302 [Coemansia sp. RSA 485]|nr:hypothetical protein IWW45_002302 [Coemansia sp. RSA 485]
MASAKQEYVRLPLRLKTKETIWGRLTNIMFIATGVSQTIAKYYWHGPEVPSWSLRFHIIKNILNKYLAESLPQDTTNDLSEKIDFRFIADYIAMNNLPSRALTVDIGHNKEFNIVVDEHICTEYKLSRYGDSGNKINVLAEEDLASAQDGQPRTVSCQIVVGAAAQICTGCKATVGQHPRLQMLEPEPLSIDERVILHLHGGAYCVGERSLTHLHVYAGMSSSTGLRVFSPNYRLAPRSCFPSQLHDCVLAYKDLLGRGFAPENIILSGDSAGGALAVALIFVLREMNAKMPVGLMLVSPWVDSTCSGESWTTNQGKDYLPPLNLENPFHPTRMFYAAGRRFSKQMLEELKCPLVSPIFGDFTGMPPMLVQIGQNELLHDDICDFVKKAKKQAEKDPNASPVLLEVYENMPHVFVLFDFADAAKQAFESMNRFAKQVFCK